MSTYSVACLIRILRNSKLWWCGSCAVNLEKDGELYCLDHMSEGDIVGEMSLLTGELRSAHVDAETAMGLV